MLLDLHTGFSGGGKVKVKVDQSYPTLCDPMEYTVHEILQARVLEWVAVLFSKLSSQTRDQTQISLIAGRFFTSWATRKVVWYSCLFKNCPQFVEIHTIKALVRKMKQMFFFLESSCFFKDPVDVDNLIAGSSAFSKFSLKIQKFSVKYCCSLAWKILSTILLAREKSTIVL